MRTSSEPRTIIDPRAFGDALRPLDRPLRSLAYRMLGNEADMDDALQEAYLRAFRNRRRFRGEAAFSTWVYRIVYTACIDRLRQRREIPVDESVVDSRPSNIPDPALQAACGVDLDRALAGLVPENRALVLLVDGEGFPYAVAAKVLSLPEGTVASRLHRIRAELRAALTDQAEAPS